MSDDGFSNDQVIYHVSETLKANTVIIQSIQEDMNEIKVDLAVIKSRDPVMAPTKAHNIKMSSMGGGIGAFLAGGIGLLLEYFKAKSGG